MRVPDYITSSHPAAHQHNWVQKANRGNGGRNTISQSREWQAGNMNRTYAGELPSQRTRKTKRKKERKGKSPCSGKNLFGTARYHPHADPPGPDTIMAVTRKTKGTQWRRTNNKGEERTTCRKGYERYL
uniref:Uncharacterized protein n=1 Tax=Trypanosoma congolense (strain IL3000) TaxID=1068625 RepID=G0URQ8_TRYCI|nr:hypothetical protein, unlikely [Trypanosoma congolense IL3000]